MIRSEFIQRLECLSEEEFHEIAPYLEADLETLDDMAALHDEIEAGRQSARDEPLVDASDLYSRIRKTLKQ